MQQIILSTESCRHGDLRISSSKTSQYVHMGYPLEVVSGQLETCVDGKHYLPICGSSVTELHTYLYLLYQSCSDLGYNGKESN